MKEASRVQAVIETITEIFKDKLPADIVLEQYFKQRRYIGAKDRRYISDLTWNIIRQRMHLQEMLGKQSSPRLFVALMLKNQDLDLLFNGEAYAPPALENNEKHLLEEAYQFEDFSDAALYECPRWLLDKFRDKKLLEALNQNAPLDLRANLTDRESAKLRLKKEGLFFSFTPLSPVGLRSEERINLNNCMTYQDGEVEVMDEGSQIISLLCNVKPHHKIIDYCAGAGGKALFFGAHMHNDGIVFVHDISQERLSRIKKRAERLDILNIKHIREVRDTDYDRFVIDAPCSGSGTWRRSPDAKFRLMPDTLREICQTQQELLDFGAKHTKVGGLLIYMTCSVFEEENSRQIEDFLSKHKEFSPVNHKELWQNMLDVPSFTFDSCDWLQLSPLNTHTDGFFFCALRKNQ